MGRFLLVCVVIVGGAGDVRAEPGARPDPSAGFDQGVGVDMSVGVVGGLHGEAAPGFESVLLWTRAGVVVFHRGWALDAGLLVLSGPSAHAADPGGMGGTGSVRRYVPLASRDVARDGRLVRVRFAAYGAAGWTRVERAGRAATPMAAARGAPPEPRADLALSGPGFAAGLELAIGSGALWSRIGLDAGYQELRGERADAGYGFTQLTFTTSVGR